MIDKIYERFDHLIEKVEARDAKAAEPIVPIVPEKSVDQLVEEAKTILPKILHTDWEYKMDKGVERDVIDMNEFKKAFNLPHTRAYAVRAELLKYLRQQKQKIQGGAATAFSGP